MLLADHPLLWAVEVDSSWLLALTVLLPTPSTFVLLLQSNHPSLQPAPHAVLSSWLSPMGVEVLQHLPMEAEESFEDRWHWQIECWQAPGTPVLHQLEPVRHLAE